MADTIRIAVVIPSNFTFSPITPGRTAAMLQPYLVLLDNTTKVSVSGGTSQVFNFGAGGNVTGYLCDDTAQIAINSNASIDLVFQVFSATGGNALYVLTGVTLKDLATNAPPGTVFPKVEIDFTGKTAGSLTLKDSPKADSRAALSYELWLLMMDSASNLGLIDPKIINQPT
jgi:hypothetical protein